MKLPAASGRGIKNYNKKTYNRVRGEFSSPPYPHHIASGSALCGSPRVLKYRPTSDCIPRLATVNTPNIIGSPCRVHRLTTAAFTISPEHWASLCCANSPGNLAFRLRSLSYGGTGVCLASRRPGVALAKTGFKDGLQTEPHGNALAFG
jgi:hypothetical protein